MKIELRNCGIVKSASLEFVNGLNLILGPSSSGKSTLFRVVRSFIDNSFSDSMISHGATKLGVSIESGEHKYVYVRDLTSKERKSSYSIDGKVYQKLGRNELPELSETLRMSSLSVNGVEQNFNFNSQFSGPFLLLSSPSTLYSVLSYHSKVDVTRLYDCYKLDLRKTKSEGSVISGIIDKYKHTLLDLNTVYESVDGFLDLYSSGTQLLALYDLYSRLYELNNRNDLFLKIDLIHCQFYDREYSILLSYSLYSSVPSIVDYTDYSSTLQKLLSYSLYSSVPPIVDYTDYSSTLQKLLSLKEKCIELDKEYTLFTSDLDNLSKQLSAYEQCPVCGSNLSEVVHEC